MSNADRRFVRSDMLLYVVTGKPNKKRERKKERKKERKEKRIDTDLKQFAVHSINAFESWFLQFANLSFCLTLR